MAKETKTEINSGGNSVEEFKALMARTNKANPKKADLEALKEAFDAAPSLALANGNAQRHISDNLIKQMAGESAFMIESMGRYVAHLKKELGWDGSSFIERLLIDEVTIRWLRLQQVEDVHRKVTNEPHTLASGLYYERRLHLTQRRYQKAIETLVKVRSLLAQANYHDERARSARSSVALKTAQLSRSLGV
jgi:hypothetical protein